MKKLLVLSGLNQNPRYRLLIELASQPFEDLCDLFNTEKQQGEDMKQYTKLLKEAIDEISMSDSNKLAIIQTEFNQLYDPNHIVRNNLETFDSVEEVRLIKETLKK